MIRKATIGAGAVALVVLLARTLAYAVEPGPAARLLEQSAGGPSLPVLATVSLALGAGVAVAVCWIVAMAVRERALIERTAARPFAVRRALVVACALSLMSCVVGGLLEAYVHWRAGLGWHGLHCLAGPVHRDLLPLETALSFVAAAILAAAQHVAEWMRRTFARLTALTPRSSQRLLRPLRAAGVPSPLLSLGTASARAPPFAG